MTAAGQCTVGDELQRAASQFYCSTSPRLDAELLMAHVLHLPRASVLARLEHELDERDALAFRAAAERRAAGVPVAYVRGRVEWWTLDLEVSPSVLIPRCDTEMLVERAVGLARAGGVIDVCDVGTGSGAIAIALAVECPWLSVSAVDVSDAALRVAARNVERQGVAPRVTLFHGSLLDPIEAEPHLITANLPYLSDDMLSTIGPDVRSEPTIALYGGVDGLDLYRALFCQVNERDWQSILLCEIDPRQVSGIKALASECLPGRHIRFWRDLGGRDRVAEVWRP